LPGVLAVHCLPGAISLVLIISGARRLRRPTSRQRRVGAPSGTRPERAPLTTAKRLGVALPCHRRGDPCRDLGGRRLRRRPCGSRFHHVGPDHGPNDGRPVTLGFQIGTTDSGYPVIHKPLPLGFTDDLAGPSGRFSHYQRAVTNLANAPALTGASRRCSLPVGTRRVVRPGAAHAVFCWTSTYLFTVSPGRTRAGPSPTARAGSAPSCPAWCLLAASPAGVAVNGRAAGCQRR